jgi:hypothetical protein
MSLVEGPSKHLIGISINVATDRAVLSDTNLFKLNMQYIPKAILVVNTFNFDV